MLFLDLLAISLGNSISLQRVPSADEWRLLFQTVQNQAVVGVCFVGVQLLKSQGYIIPEDVYFEWLAVAVQIKERNEHMNQWTTQLCRSIEKDGYRCCALKGQSLARLYGQTGSIANADNENELNYDLLIHSKKKQGSPLIIFLKH